MRCRSLALLACGLFLALPSSGRADAGWSLLHVPNPPARTGGFNAVSCRRPSWCMAVGRSADASGQVVAFSARWDGAARTAVPTPSPPGAPGSRLAGVACTSRTSCIAVGAPTDGFFAAGTLAERWDGARWRILPTPRAAGGFLIGVSCASGTACTAVGNHTPTQLPGRSLAERWDGSDWTIEPTVDPVGPRGSVLDAVACPSVASCTAVGNLQSQDGNPLGILIERSRGDRWKIEPAPNPAAAGGALLAGVDCVSQASCTAVGARFDSSGVPAALVERRAGGRWRIVASPSGGGAFLAAAACPARRFCMAVGFTTDGAGPPSGTLAERWDGRRWSVMRTPSPALDSFLSGVSCPSASACSATGLDDGFPPHTLAARWSGGAWTDQPTPTLPIAYDIVPPLVACPSVVECVAASGYANNGLFVNVIERWSPFAATAPALPAHAPDAPRAVAGRHARPTGVASWLRDRLSIEMR
jgi:hypothetical protein